MKKQNLSKAEKTASKAARDSRKTARGKAWQAYSSKD
jgi:hypothetical protein